MSGSEDSLLSLESESIFGSTVIESFIEVVHNLSQRIIPYALRTVARGHHRPTPTRLSTPSGRQLGRESM
jgi:hypothetical protein